jgi:hypothetical protein
MNNIGLLIYSMGFEVLPPLVMKIYNFEYSKTSLKRNLKGPEHFSAEARFPFNHGSYET